MCWFANSKFLLFSGMSLQCSLKLGCPFRPLSPLLCACTGCRAKDSRDSNELATEYTVCNPSSGFLGSSWAVEAQEAQWPVSWLATARKCLNSSCSSQSLHTPWVLWWEHTPVTSTAALLSQAYDPVSSSPLLPLLPQPFSALPRLSPLLPVCLYSLCTWSSGPLPLM